MSIKRLLIDSRIQGFWYGHTKTGRDRRRDREEGGGHGSWMPACSSTCSGLMTVAAVSGSARWLSVLVERVGWWWWWWWWW